MRNTLLAAFTLLLLLGITQPIQAQTIDATWSAQYFDNAVLEAPPVFTQQVDEIAVDWGTGSPGEGIDTDEFSVRWATDIVLPAGDYRFYARADDNIAVTVDFSYTPLINTFERDVTGEMVTADITLEQGSHHIQVDYREITGEAFAYVAFANLADNPVPPDFNAPTSDSIELGNWTANYYPNQELTPPAAVIRTEDNPTDDWGAGSPAPSIPADNWSARWVTTANLTGGEYQIRAFADDGVRVYVDGVLVIDEFDLASGEPFTVRRDIAAGNHTFTVEFFEAEGVAFLDFDIFPVGERIDPNLNTETVTINTRRLNVRDAPSIATGDILLRVNRDETYPAVARTADNRWIQINVRGTLGWVSTSFVTVRDLAGVPVIGEDTTITLTATPFTVNIRTGPGTEFQDIGNLPAERTAEVIGRNSNSTWWQINYRDIVGWVAAEFTTLEAGVDVSQIPITG